MRYLFLCMLLTALCAQAQDDHVIKVTIDGESVPYEPLLTDQEIQQKAREMAVNNEFVYVTAGNMTGQLSTFETFFKEYLQTEHNIGYRFYGCMLMPGQARYMAAMNSELYEKYGKEFIHEERAKAKIIFQNKA